MADIASLYSSRGGLPPESPVFVGRTRTANDIIRRLANPLVNKPGVAVVGPRRIGKTSLLRQLLVPDFRKRLYPNTADWPVAYLDLSGEPWAGVERFRRKAIDALARAVGLNLTDLWSDEHSFARSVEEILRVTSAQTVLLLLDELNSVAADLDRNDQTAIRAALDGQTTGRFSIIFAVSHSPEELLEYIPNEIQSQLAGVINVAFPRLGGLAPAEAAELVRIGRVTNGLAPDGEAERWLTERVGTHPLLLHSACYAWYAVAQERTLRSLPEMDVTEADEAMRQEVLTQWNHVAPTLGGETRSYLRHGGSGSMPDEVRTQLQSLGLGPFVANFLAARTTRSAPTPMIQQAPASWYSSQPVDRLLQAIDDLNTRQTLNLKRQTYVFRADDLLHNERVLLGRTTKKEEDFRLSVLALAKLLYDGSNGVVSPPERGVLKPTLPRWCYNDFRCVVTQILAIRNYLTHLSAVVAEVRQQHIDSACEVFECYCGRTDPTCAEQWDTIRLGLISAAGDFVIKLLDFVPVTRDLTVEQFLGAVSAAGLPQN